MKKKKKKVTNIINCIKKIFHINRFEEEIRFICQNEETHYGSHISVAAD
jgi:hypothetical protein